MYVCVCVCVHAREREYPASETGIKETREGSTEREKLERRCGRGEAEERKRERERERERERKRKRKARRERKERTTPSFSRVDSERRRYLDQSNHAASSAFYHYFTCFPFTSPSLDDILWAISRCKKVTRAQPRTPCFPRRPSRVPFWYPPWLPRGPPPSGTPSFRGVLLSVGQIAFHGFPPRANFDWFFLLLLRCVTLRNGIDFSRKPSGHRF